MVNRVCTQCSATFNKSPAAIARGEGRFCSNVCRDTYKRLHVEERSGTRAPLWKGGVHKENRRTSGRIFAMLNPEKTRAYEIVRQAIDAGTLQRQPCEGCGATDNIQAHHEDYMKPLDVIWFCPTCHTKHHLLRKQRLPPKPRDRRRQMQERAAAKLPC